MSAMQDALAKIELTARRTAFHKVKARARHYRRFRLEMGAVDGRLPFAHPRTLIAIGEHLVEVESRRPNTRVQLVNVPLTNARAVLLVGRYERRFVDQELQEVA